VIATTLGRLADVTGGRLIGDAETQVTGVARIDSREVGSGDLFVAWRGERADGHDFVASAAEAGAVVALVEREVDAPVAQIVVADTVKALTALAADHARQLAPTCVIVGITGSNGKTSTKDLVAQIFESVGPTVSPPGSFNNEIGLPVTILRADGTTRFLVLEMGARGIGHIAHLVEVAQPRIGAALNVGSAHVGEFGGPDQIAQAKGEIVEALPSDGSAVLNGDDARTRAMAARTRAHVVLFGRGENNDVRATDIVVGDDACATFVLHHQADAAEVRLSLPGAHAVDNALAAVAIALSAGVPFPIVADALGRAVPRSRWRMEITTTGHGVVVVNDAYNANPESVAAALSSVAGMPRGARLWAVLGEMLELGDRSEAAHRRVGQQVASSGVDVLVVVGADAVAPLATAAHHAGLADSAIVRVANAAAAAELVARDAAPGDVVLIKASRGIGLEVVAEALHEAGATA
jgi:UDP-N-acetylmuramoyl-tripeptide--D-alanyl-D-alanine ligase